MSGDTRRRRVRTMRASERVVDIDIAEGREPSCERVVVLLLARQEPRILHQEDGAIRQRLGRGDGRGVIGRCAEGHVDAGQHLPECRQNRRQRERRIGSALRSAEVREQHDPRPLATQELNCRHRGLQPGIVADRACVVERHVEIHAHDDTAPAHLRGRQILHGALLHQASVLPTYCSRSTQRLE